MARTRFHSTQNTSTIPLTGLTETEVAHRVDQGKTNQFRLRPTRSYLQIILANVFNVYNLILAASSSLVLFLQGSKDVVAAAALLFLNTTIGLAQEIRAKFMLDRLAALTVKTVTVRRNGKSQEIPFQEIVQDDLIELLPGAPIVVDGPVIQSDSLEVNESSLTGESEYVPKKAGEWLTSGSYSAAGAGLMQARKIGKLSSLNKLTKTAKTLRLNRTPLEKWLNSVFQVLLIVIIIFAPLTIVAGINNQLPLARSLENVVNLVSSLVPQGLIMSVTILFAYGVLSITRFKALIQRVNAVESMGHITIMCVDKTGTLTKNQLVIDQIVPLGLENSGVRKNLPVRLLQQLHQYTQHISWKNRTIQAIAEYVDKQFTVSAIDKKMIAKKAEVAFTSEKKWSGIEFENDGKYVMGAPEVLLTDPKLLQQAQDLSSKGLRVLVFGTVANLAEHTELKPLAFLLLKDEIRTAVAETIRQFAQQNVKLKIISGDSPDTVRAVALQAGISDPGQPLTGPEIDLMGDEQLDKKVRDVLLFARISPQTKRRIITILIRQGHYVAMVGDGVNDVPALKQAKIAIAMNDGAQITKDVADIVLLNNSFSTLPKAIEEGREITQRIYAVTKIFFVKVVYFVVLFVLIGFAGLPFPITLRQTTWLGFIIVGVPTTLIAFRILKPAPTKNVLRDVLRYCLVSGLVGGLIMTFIPIVTLVFASREIELSRTIVTTFATLYSAVILWNVLGIRFFNLESIAQHWRSALIVILIAVIAVVTPVYVFPFAFFSVQLGVMPWLLLAVLFGVAVVSFKLFLQRIKVRRILKRIF